MPNRPVLLSQAMSAAREAQAFQKIERLFEPRRHQEAAPRRQAADEQFEYGRLGIAMVQVSLDHVDLIKVRQQRTDVFHRGGPLRKLADNISASFKPPRTSLSDPGGQCVSACDMAKTPVIGSPGRGPFRPRAVNRPPGVARHSRHYHSDSAARIRQLSEIPH